MTAKTLVLVHGASMCVQPDATGRLTEADPEHWEHVVWGNPDTFAKGRLATALDYILGQTHPENYELAVGTGLEERDVTPRRSVQLMLDAVQSARNGLTTLDFAHSLDQPAVAELLAHMNVWDCTNTGEELDRALDYCLHNGIGTLVVVSSPAHVGRCLTMALQKRAADPALSTIDVIGVASRVDFASTTVADTVALEGVHHALDNEAGFTPDQRHLTRTALVRRMFRVSGDKLLPFRTAFDELLTRFGG